MERLVVVLKVRRNDPCTCGSGKKYKKCCGKKALVVSMEELIQGELNQLKDELPQFVAWNYGDQLTEKVLEEVDSPSVPKEVHDICFLMRMDLSIFHADVGNGKTAIDEFIAKHLRTIKRPQVANILESWREGAPAFLKVLEMDGKELKTQDILMNVEKKIRLTEEPSELSSGDIIIGVIIPMGTFYTFFSTYIDFPSKFAKNIQSLIHDLYKRSGEASEVEFLKNEFTSIISSCYAMYFNRMLFEDLQWKSPVYEEVLNLYHAGIEKEEQKELMETIGNTTWFAYCEKVQPRINNKGLYAAALHYVVDQLVHPFNSVTLKDLGKRYGASPSSISQRAKQIEEVLDEELIPAFEEFAEGEMIEEEEVSPFLKNRMFMERTLLESERKLEGMDLAEVEDLTAYLNDDSIPTRPLTKEEEAQELIFDAYEATGKERDELIQQALELDPNNADAYNLLAQKANSSDEALYYYREGMIRGARSLGKEFFDENKGHFWSIVKTRPFMRAKYYYAFELFRNDETEEAMQQLEELLELNPSDHQGARHLLFTIYVEEDQFNKAKQLLEQYQEEHSPFILYNRVLIELLQHGPTLQAKQWLKKAQKQNPHVLAFLLNEMEFYDIPSMYTPGDQDEAKIYLSEFGHFWILHEKYDLIEWLKEMEAGLYQGKA